MNKPKLTPIQEPELDALADKWKSAIVARKVIKDFTGGLVSAGSLANADSQGEGPEGKFYHGRDAAYPVPAVIAWLKKRCRTDRLPAVDRTNRGRGGGK